MEFRFLCPFCDQKLKADDTAVGKAVDCLYCRKEFIVPAPVADGPDSVTPPPLLSPLPDNHQAPQMPYSVPEASSEGEHTCPVCWLRFDTSAIMHIAVHDSLRGDPVLGEDAQQRFLATRFNNADQGLDAMGLPCSDIACPHCRRKLPPGFLEMAHHIISVVGDASAGKSYYLSVLTKVLPATLFRQFGIVFHDSDPTGNAPVNDMRKALFGAQNPTQAKLAKTVLEGAMYERLPRQGRTVALPRPFVYTLTSREKAQEQCALIFYDNAGEHFQPGIKITEQPGAQHVASAGGIVFLFDPFNSPEFRRRIREAKDPQLEKPIVDQQDIILAEMRARITSLRNLRASERIHTPLAFVVGKCDAWLHVLNGSPLLNPIQEERLDMAAITANSERIRSIMHELCPAVLANAEALSENIEFFATSSFGHTPIKIGPGEYVPDPARLEPFFVEVPLLWILSKVNPGFLTPHPMAARSSP
jgi:hypothetical protein